MFTVQISLLCQVERIFMFTVQISLLYQWSCIFMFTVQISLLCQVELYLYVHSSDISLVSSGAVSLCSQFSYHFYFKWSRIFMRTSAISFLSCGAESLSSQFKNISFYLTLRQSYKLFHAEICFNLQGTNGTRRIATTGMAINQGIKRSTPTSHRYQYFINLLYSAQQTFFTIWPEMKRHSFVMSEIL